MAEFNSKKGFVFVSKIKNLYFVPNDISREIDSMLICSGKNPNKYIKRRISYIEKFNFDEQLITKIAMDVSYPVSCVEVQNIILHYETYFD